MAKKKTTKKTKEDKAPRRRKLSDSDKEFILNHCNDMSKEEMAKGMHGIGVKTIEKFINENVVPESKSGETYEERQHKLQQNIRGAGQFMARDKERGFVAMTGTASEIADARKSKREKEKKHIDNSDRVYKLR